MRSLASARLIRTDTAPPPHPRRRQTTHPRPPPDRYEPAPARSTNEGLRREEDRRGPLQDGDHPLLEAIPRPRGLLPPQPRHRTHPPEHETTPNRRLTLRRASGKPNVLRQDHGRRRAAATHDLPYFRVTPWDVDDAGGVSVRVSRRTRPSCSNRGHGSRIEDQRLGDR